MIWKFPVRRFSPFLTSVYKPIYRLVYDPIRIGVNARAALYAQVSRPDQCHQELRPVGPIRVNLSQHHCRV